MTDFNTDFNVQMQPDEPITLIHEVSTTEFIIGVSTNGRDTSKPIWKIKKILKTGSVWSTTLFPNGDQRFIFIWDSRIGYTYI